MTTTMALVSQNKLEGGAGEVVAWVVWQQVEEAAEADRCKQFSIFDISWIAMQMTLGCESLLLYTINNLEPQ